MSCSIVFRTISRGFSKRKRCVVDALGSLAPIRIIFGSAIVTYVIGSVLPSGNPFFVKFLAVEKDFVRAPRCDTLYSSFMPPGILIRQSGN